MSDWLDEIWPVKEETKQSYKILYKPIEVSLKNPLKTEKVNNIFRNRLNKINKLESERKRRRWMEDNLEGLYEIFLVLKEKCKEYGLRLKTSSKWDDFLEELIEVCYMNSCERGVSVNISKIENSQEFLEEFTLEFEDLFNEVLKYGLNRNEKIYLDFPVYVVRNLLMLYIDIEFYMKEDNSTIVMEESEGEEN